jgi:hypothetical protein
MQKKYLLAYRTSLKKKFPPNSLKTTDKKGMSIYCIPTATFVSPGRSMSVKLTTARVKQSHPFENFNKTNKQIDHKMLLLYLNIVAHRSSYYI